MEPYQLYFTRLADNSAATLSRNVVCSRGSHPPPRHQHLELAVRLAWRTPCLRSGLRGVSARRQSIPLERNCVRSDAPHGNKVRARSRPRELKQPTCNDTAVDVPRQRVLYITATVFYPPRPLTRRRRVHAVICRWRWCERRHSQMHQYGRASALMAFAPARPRAQLATMRAAVPPLAPNYTNPDQIPRPTRERRRQNGNRCIRAAPRMYGPCC